MTISELLLPVLDDEMANTRKLLQRVHLDATDWSPHAKSMTMRRLASHIADIPRWGSEIVERESFDVQPGTKPYSAASPEELLQHFDSEVSAARKAIAGADDEHLQQKWTFSFRGHAVFSRPRYQVLSILMMNHLIHHRGQLSVYLRLKDIPVPGMYGPSADEQ